MKLLWWILLIFTLFVEASTNWSEDRIIDIHAHFGTFRGYDLSLETLMDNMKRYGISFALISNIDGADLSSVTKNLSEREANRVTIEVVKTHPQLFRGLLWTRPLDGSVVEVESLLEEKLSDSGERVFVGMKFHPNMNQFPADDPAVDRYLLLCEKYRIPAVFHCGDNDSFSSPQRIYNVAKRHPGVAVILYHMGVFGPHQYAIEAVNRSRIKKDADLYLETAQADPGAVLQAVRELGSERVLFGSDATYYGKEHYSRYEKMIQKLRTELSDQDFTNVVHDNAQRLFNLK